MVEETKELGGVISPVPNSKKIIFLYNDNSRTFLLSNSSKSPIYISALYFNLVTCGSGSDIFIDTINSQYKVNKNIEAGESIQQQLGTRSQRRLSNWPMGVYATGEDGQIIEVDDITEKPHYNPPKPDNLYPELGVIPIIPEPNSMEVIDGHLTYPEEISIINKTEWSLQVLELVLEDGLFPQIKFNFCVEENVGEMGVKLQIEEREEIRIREERYILNIYENSIIILCSSQRELTAALSTLIQIIFFTISRGKVECLRIDDSPCLRYRGLLIDSSRNFLPFEDVKIIMKHCALYKINNLHLHLTDNEGWRVEIKSFPQLTHRGAWRGHSLIIPPQVGSGPHVVGGFYTQEEIKCLVQFGERLGIRLIPEIDVPSHCSALLTSLVQLRPEEYRGKTEEYYAGVLNPANEQTFPVLFKILEEIIDLFPGKIIHIGADEVPYGHWSAKDAEKLGLDSKISIFDYFIEEIMIFLDSKGCKLSGWDEIIRKKASKLMRSHSIAQIWHGGLPERAEDCIKQEREYILSPSTHLYFDQPQSNKVRDPGHLWAGVISLEKVYSFNPIPRSLGTGAMQFCLGVEGCLWGELIDNIQKLEYMGFPRILALSEVGWTDRLKREKEKFMKKVIYHQTFFNILKINYRPINLTH